jgi:hypothetical protein
MQDKAEERRREWMWLVADDIQVESTERNPERLKEGESKWRSIANRCREGSAIP